jgi:DNA-binding NtrC family response regulator
MRLPSTHRPDGRARHRSPGAAAPLASDLPALGVDESVLAGDSDVAHELRRAVERAAPARAVVVRGPAGSGRRGVARALHALGEAGAPAVSPRPYIEVRCTGLTGSWGADHLLGTVARPGLFSAAAGGTLTLIGIEALDADLQSLLAEALASGQFLPLGARAPRLLDLRIVAVTCDEELDRVLASLDLAYRLNDHCIDVPPLATRGPDLPAIAGSALARLGGGSLSAQSEAVLAARPFIGGLDELVELLEAAARHAGPLPIAPEHLERAGGLDAAPAPFRSGTFASTPLESGRSNDLLPLGDRSWRSVERALIVHVLAESDGNRSHAARVLGFNRSTLYNKLRQHGIE